MGQSRRPLTVADRVEIATGLTAGWSCARIGEQIGRDRSVVWREVARNSTAGGYRVVHADCQAQRRRGRPQPGKVASDAVLQARVLADLTRG